jgi:hypothetical protein
MSNSVVRLPNSTSIAIFSGVTRAVECGFMAAGVTVAAIAAVQSIAILVGWVAAV